VEEEGKRHISKGIRRVDFFEMVFNAISFIGNLSDF
jgi:hypothetical protein